MVRWYHAIFSAYGYWLPNDPRGSWSTFVGSWDLFRTGGGATKTDARHSIADAPHDRELRNDVNQILKYPAVRFDPQQRDGIANGLQWACDESCVNLHAAAIGYDHVHVVVGRHAKSVEQVVGLFKGRSTQLMNARGCHPLREFAGVNATPPSPWSRGGWSVFINDERQLHAAVAYVNRHPEKEGLPPRHWPCLTPV